MQGAFICRFCLSLGWSVGQSLDILFTRAYCASALVLVQVLLNPISHGVKHGGGEGGYYDQWLKQIFPDRFLALSLHI
jgi:hypothetical protein